MSKRRRMSGRERREQRRRARQGLASLGPRVALVVAAVTTPIIIALVLILFVIDGDDDVVEPPIVAASPTAQSEETVTVTDEGPPPVAGEPTFSETGLGIIDIETGTGETPEAGQTLAVHYTGWLSDGTKFDSSLDRGSPFEFALGQGRVISGWDEGVATMKVGGKRRLIIPAELAYGEQERSGIPPNSELTFDIELLEIKEAPASP